MPPPTLLDAAAATPLPSLAAAAVAATPTPAAAASPPAALSVLAQWISAHVDALVLEAADAQDGQEQGQPGGGWPDWPSVPNDGAGAPLPSRLPGRGGQGTGHSPDHTLAIVIPLVVILTTLLVLILLLTVLLLRRRRAIELLDDDGPTRLDNEDQLDGEGGLDGVEARWLQSVDEQTKMGYVRAKIWQTQYPPNSQPTEITLSQFLSIQEKGVSAWSFEPDYESNAAIVVEQRTEITFLADGYGMAPEEGGGCNVQSNLPVPKLNDVYYFEAKMYDKPEGTNVAIGLATKPYPSFRLPGVSRYSVAYHSADGFKSHSYPFTATSYGPPLQDGDVLGVGYRPRTGTVFFTRNGKKLDEAYVGFNRHNVFPTIGATGPCAVHVNLGQAGFVFIEANVKKWGLAPMMGTLAPPPAYGSERGSILLEAAGGAPASSSSSSRARAGGRRAGQQHHRRSSSLTASAASAAQALGGSSGASGNGGSGTPTQPIRPSPLRHSHSRQTSAASAASSSSQHRHHHGGGGGSDDDGEDGDGHNPPTPGLLDISLHSMHRFPDPVVESDEEEEEEARLAQEEDEEDEGSASDGERDEEDRALLRSPANEEQERRDGRDERANGDGASARSVSPPAYNPVDPYMYAPGVAETMLEDAFAAAAAASQPAPSTNGSGGAAATAGARPGAGPALTPQQAALVAHFAQQRRLQGLAGAGAGAGGATGSGASSPGYEARTEDASPGGTGSGAAARLVSGRGGAGNVSAGGGGGFWAWFNGRRDGGEGPEGEQRV
ncbi:SSH4 family protein [Rhodotorula paludigena]|uniref:SSH4 family protein n=1 Tax=Rhodotorula paludigena TaxID=86838 RepID=UPI0031823A4B